MHRLSARIGGAASALAALVVLGCGGSAGSGLLVADVADGGADAASGGSGAGGSATGAGSSGSTIPGGNVGGPGGDTQSLACGSVSCAIPAESCCVSETNGFACIGGTTCPAPDAGGGGSSTALRCSGAANCPAGTACCVYETNGVVAADCKPSCGKSEAQLCDPTAATSGCAPGSGACSSKNISDWGLPHGYATCGGVGN